MTADEPKAGDRSRRFGYEPGQVVLLPPADDDEPEPDDDDENDELDNESDEVKAKGGGAKKPHKPKGKGGTARTPPEVRRAAANVAKGKATSEDQKILAEWRKRKKTAGTETNAEGPVEPRRFINGKAGARWGQKHYREWAEQLTPEQQAAIRDYRGAGFRDLNEILRGQRSAVGPEVDAHRVRVRTLDSALEGARTPEAVVVHRGIHDVKGVFRLKSSQDLGSIVGREYVDGGYGSTSVDPRKATDFAIKRAGREYAADEPGTVEIRVPAGFRAAYISRAAGEYHERELLLDRGTRYRVLEADPGRRHVVVEAIESRVDLYAQRKQPDAVKAVDDAGDDNERFLWAPGDLVPVSKAQFDPDAEPDAESDTSAPQGDATNE